MRHEDDVLRTLLLRMTERMNQLLLHYERSTPSIDQALVERTLAAMEQARELARTL